jgi:membrane protease YdiL (CAAX protease family)
MAEAQTRAVSLNRLVAAWVVALFAITGIGMAPLFFYQLDLSKLTFSSRIPLIVGIGIELTAYAPTLAALTVAGLMLGGGGIRRLMRPVIRWRVGLHWYAIALVGPSLLFLAGDVIRFAVGAALPGTWLAVPSAAAFAFLIGALIAGSFGEEVGWRGVGQRQLQQKYGALWAAVVVGVIWSLWHLWPVAAPGGLGTSTWSEAGLTFVRLIATSVIYAWLFNSTRGSLVIVMLAHAGHNLAVRLVPPADSVQHGDPVVTSLYVAAAVVVVLWAGSRWLSRVHEFPEPLRQESG